MSQNNKLSHLRRLHEVPSDATFKAIWEKGLFIFDTNVLLDLYRVRETARKDIVKTLEHPGFKSRIWVTFQSIMEFENSRLNVIHEQRKRFDEVRKVVETAKTDVNQILHKLMNKLTELQLSQRHSLIDPEDYVNNDIVEGNTKFLTAFTDYLDIQETKQQDLNDQDVIKPLVYRLFKERVGTGLTKEHVTSTISEGKSRFNDQLPPGFKDHDKPGISYLQKVEYPKKYGDLFLWEEIKAKVIKDKYEYVVLVTGDVKEDWWYKVGGKNLGPRKELLDELYSECPSVKNFWMYNTFKFLEHAKTQLNVLIDDDSIQEVKEVVTFNSIQDEYDHVVEVINLYHSINIVLRQNSGLNANISTQLTNLPDIKLFGKAQWLNEALISIFQNVANHGNDNEIDIDVKNIATNVVGVTFSNSFDPEPSNTESIKEKQVRAKGIRRISYALNVVGMSFVYDEDSNQEVFKATIEIPVSRFTETPSIP